MYEATNAKALQRGDVVVVQPPTQAFVELALLVGGT
jgi:hypothetical protein